MAAANYLGERSRHTSLLLGLIVDYTKAEKEEVGRARANGGKSEERLGQSNALVGGSTDASLLGRLRHTFVDEEQAEKN